MSQLSPPTGGQGNHPVNPRNVLSEKVARRLQVLPHSLPPRGLSREEAAGYIGVSPTLFDQMVADRRMPKPKRINARRVWDRIQVDAAFSALPNDGEEDRADDVWARCAV
jgi:predicted DNA-binding transcriptional regulator AlpA